MLKELKKELSKLSGIDFFNPKYRDIFKKYFPDEKEDKEENTEVETPKEETKEVAKDDTKVETKEEATEEKAEEEIKDKTEDLDKAEDEREIDKIEEEKADTEKVKEDKKEDKEEETKEIAKDVDTESEDIKDIKIENILYKNNVRADKINALRRIIKIEVEDLNDAEKIKEIIDDYPEWLNNNSKKVGMSLDDEDNRSNEDKVFKEITGHYPER